MLPQLSLVEDDFLSTIRKVSRDGYCRLHIDPSDAKSLLERNTGNRKLRESVVNYYAKEMRNNKWLDNGDPIRIARSGRLLNGQHRLSALVKAGVTLPFHFLSNLSEESFEQMDNGAHRSVSDNLNMSFRDVAVLKVIYLMKSHIFIYENGHRRVGPSEIKSVMTDEITEILEEIPLTKRANVANAYTNAAAVLCILFGYPKERILRRQHNVLTVTPSNNLEVAFNRWVTNVTQNSGVNRAFQANKMLPAFYKYYITDDPEPVQVFRLNETEATTILKDLHNQVNAYFRSYNHP